MDVSGLDRSLVERLCCRGRKDLNASQFHVCPDVHLRRRVEVADRPIRGDAFMFRDCRLLITPMLFRSANQVFDVAFLRLVVEVERLIRIYCLEQVNSSTSSSCVTSTFMTRSFIPPTL